MSYKHLDSNKIDKDQLVDGIELVVPSITQLLCYMDANGLSVSCEELAQHFQLKDKESVNALHTHILHLIDKKLVLEGKNRKISIRKSVKLVQGKIIGHPNGYGFVAHDKRDKDLYIQKSQMRRVIHGDQVLCWVKQADRNYKAEIEIIGVINRRKHRLVGEFRKHNGDFYVIPHDQRICNRITIPRNKTGHARPGDIVLLTLTSLPFAPGSLTGEILEVIGTSADSTNRTNIAIHNHDLPYEWTDEVRVEIQQQKEQIELPAPDRFRINIRDLALVTIDGPDAKDFDDAVFCRETSNGWQLTVAIADVSHYVKSGGAIDREAYIRGNSVYFPDKVIPMLPEHLSNGCCSLLPFEDRNCMVCEINLDHNAGIEDYRFYQAVMRSQARFTYDDIDTLLLGKAAGQGSTSDEIVGNLENLYALSQALKNNRLKNGSIEFELPEPMIRFNSHGQVDSITTRSRLVSHQLVEECMLAANCCAAGLMHKALGDNAIYRIHAGPTAKDLIVLRQFLASVGLSLSGDNSPEAVDYQRVLNQAKNNPHIAVAVQAMLLRSLGQAAYSHQLGNHFALSFSIYTHFTSPIRRYSDLVVHRLIKSILSIPGYTADVDNMNSKADISSQCSMAERRADSAVYEVIGWHKVSFMSEKIGEQFAGTVTGVREFGLFVQLDEILVDGLVHVSQLGADYFHFDEVRQQLIGERAGTRYKLGDQVNVVVSQVNLNEAKVDLVLADTVSGKISSRGKRRNRKYGG